MPHHDEYDGSTSQSKGLTQAEVRHWRDELYREIAYRFREDVEERKLRAQFEYLEQLMPDLLKVMRRELKRRPLLRLAVMRETITKSDERLTGIAGVPWLLSSHVRRRLVKPG